MHYFKIGHGPPIIWIQGVGACGSAWRPQISSFSKDYTCVSMDNRGIGLSQPSGVITVPQMASDVEAICSAEGWNQIHLVGHSLGGLIALQFARDHPSRLISLSLLCTFANGRSVAPLSPGMIYWGARSVLGTASMRRYAFLRLVLPKKYVHDHNTEQLANDFGALMGRDLASQPAIIGQQLKAMRRCNLLDQIGAITRVPTLVVSAAHDPIATPALGRRIATAMPGASYVELAECSHAAPIHATAQVNQLLADQFQRGSGS